MSDPEKSDAPTTAPVETAGATPSVAPTGATQPFGTFGSTRGSGLARGKRATPVAAPAAKPAAPSSYKPSSLEVITPKSEYVNPFTGETTVNAPARPEPVERVVNEPAPQAAPQPAVAPTMASAPAPEAQTVKVEAPTPVAPTVKPAHVYIEPTPAAPARSDEAPAGELFPFNPPASSAPKTAPAVDSSSKPELNILPPQEAKRPAVSWEAPSSAPAAQPPQNRDDRATFRTERNRREGGEARPFEPREPRRDERKFEPREPRRDERKFEPRSNQPYQPRDPRDERPERIEPEVPKKSGGFFGWLKGLFGGGASTETPATGSPAQGGGEPRRDFDRSGGGQRRHRGGRGRGRGGFQGDNRGPRDGQQRQPRDPRDEGGQPQQGGGEPYRGEPRGEGDFGGGGGRRRRRGGRGRFRGEGGGGGDRGDRGPNPEGQQGGGAI